jgi:hypothetical protein
MPSKIINGIEYANFPEEELRKIGGLVDDGPTPLANEMRKIAGSSAQLPAVKKLLDVLADVESRLSKSDGLAKAAAVDGRFDAVFAEAKKISASDAREQLKRDAVDADPATRARLRAMGEYEAFAKRDA